MHYPTRECYDESPSLSQLSAPQRLTVFFFFTGPLPAHCSLSGCTRKSGSRRGHRDHLRRAFRISAVCPCVTALFRTSSGCVKPAVVYHRATDSLRAGLSAVWLSAENKRAARQYFGGIYIGLTFNGGIGFSNPIPSAWRARASLNLVGRVCGDRWVGRWRPFAGLLFNINPKLNFAVASCSGRYSLFCWRGAGLLRTAGHAGSDLGRQSDAGGCAASADAAAFLGAGLFCRRDLHLRRLRPTVPGLLFLAVRNLAGRERDVRLPEFFPVFLEAAGMFCAPWLVNRIGAKTA